MAITGTPFVNGAVISASDVKSRLQEAEDWVNGGIIVGDTSHTGWVSNDHIYGPDFYGAPAPRAEFTTGQTHWRISPDDRTRAEVFHEEMRGAFVPVEGLNATIKLQEASNVVVTASWWAWETGNKNAGYLNGNFHDKGNSQIAQFGLFHEKHTFGEPEIAATRIQSTTRPLFYSKRGAVGWSRYSAKQMSVHRCITDLPAGIHTIGIRCNVSGETGGGSHDQNTTDGSQKSMNVFVRNRHLIVDVYPRSSSTKTNTVNSTQQVP